MLQKPKITVWVLSNGYIYSARVSHRNLDGYWHEGYDVDFKQEGYKYNPK